MTPDSLDPELKRRLMTARRETRKAVERASNVDLRLGHAIEARRLTEQILDAATDLIEALEKR